jgi:uncharacterized protein YabE (DUF348 family)
MMNAPTRSKKLLVISSLLLVGILLAALAFLFSRTQYIVYADNKVHLIRGEYERVEDVLDAAGIEVRDEDIVSPPLANPVEPGDTIQIQRAIPITLRTEAGVQTRWTLQTNLAAFLAEANVVVGRTDQVFADGQPVAFAGLEEAPVPRVKD